MYRWKTSMFFHLYSRNRLLTFHYVCLRCAEQRSRNRKKSPQMLFDSETESSAVAKEKVPRGHTHALGQLKFQSANERFVRACFVRVSCTFVRPYRTSATTTTTDLAKICGPLFRTKPFWIDEVEFFGENGTCKYRK